MKGHTTSPNEYEYKISYYYCFVNSKLKLYVRKRIFVQLADFATFLIYKIPVAK